MQQTPCVKRTLKKPLSFQLPESGGSGTRTRVLNTFPEEFFTCLSDCEPATKECSLFFIKSKIHVENFCVGLLFPDSEEFPLLGQGA